MKNSTNSVRVIDSVNSKFLPESLQREAVYPTESQPFNQKLPFWQELHEEEVSYSETEDDLFGPNRAGQDDIWTGEDDDPLPEYEDNEDSEESEDEETENPTPSQPSTPSSFPNLQAFMQHQKTSILNQFLTATTTIETVHNNQDNLVCYLNHTWSNSMVRYGQYFDESDLRTDNNINFGKSYLGSSFISSWEVVSPNVKIWYFGLMEELARHNLTTNEEGKVEDRTKLEVQLAGLDLVF